MPPYRYGEILWPHKSKSKCTTQSRYSDIMDIKDCPKSTLCDLPLFEQQRFSNDNLAASVSNVAPCPYVSASCYFTSKIDNFRTQQNLTYNNNTITLTDSLNPLFNSEISPLVMSLVPHCIKYWKNIILIYHNDTFAIW